MNNLLLLILMSIIKSDCIVLSWDDNNVIKLILCGMVNLINNNGGCDLVGCINSCKWLLFNFSIMLSRKRFTERNSWKLAMVRYSDFSPKSVKGVLRIKGVGAFISNRLLPF